MHAHTSVCVLFVICWTLRWYTHVLIDHLIHFDRLMADTSYDKSVLEGEVEGASIKELKDGLAWRLDETIKVCRQTKASIDSLNTVEGHRRALTKAIVQADNILSETQQLLNDFLGK